MKTFCRCIVLIAGLGLSQITNAQETVVKDGKGVVNLVTPPQMDSLVIIHTQSIARKGINGFRILIFNQAGAKSRASMASTRADFVQSFPTLKVHESYENPYYKLKIGDFRSKIEGYKYLMEVKKVFPNAYLVPDLINFPQI